MIQPGDILFYGSSGNLTDMAIAFFTRSPFVHCSVAISPFSQIEALGQGIIQSSIPTPRAIWHLQDNSTDYHFDCSALCTEFLVKAGGVDLGGLELDPHTVTPGILAKQLRVS